VKPSGGADPYCVDCGTDGRTDDDGFCSYCAHRVSAIKNYAEFGAANHSDIDARIAAAKADIDRSSESRRAAIGAGNPRLRLGVKVPFVEGGQPWEGED
jgi:hypothetical protein